MNAPEADELLLDLAIKSGLRQAELNTKLTASSFRAWGCLLSRPRPTYKQHPEAADVTTGRNIWKPKTSGLLIHPIVKSESESGGDP